jgi:uncharacterized protein YkvS
MSIVQAANRKLIQRSEHGDTVHFKAGLLEQVLEERDIDAEVVKRSHLVIDEFTDTETMEKTLTSQSREFFRIVINANNFGFSLIFRVSIIDLF